MSTFSISNDILQPLALWLGISSAYIVMAVVLFVVCLAMAFFWRSHKKAISLQKKLERLQHDLLVANSSAIGMGQKLLALEKQLYSEGAVNPANSTLDRNVGAERIEPTDKKVHLKVIDNTTLNQASSHPNDLPNDAVYEQTRLLLAQGIDIQEVIKRSGLSYSEVSLMQSLVK